MEYQLCSKFGWTLQELRNMPESDLDMFIKIMNIESQFNNRDIKESKRQIDSYRNYGSRYRR